MTRGLNKVMLIGHLGADPELKYLPSGVGLTTFRVAVSRAWRTPEGEPREEAEWFRCVAWRQLAETANQYMRKGNRVYVEGRLRTRRWQDDGGQEHTTTEVEVDELLFLDGRPAAHVGEPADATQPDETDPLF